MGIPQPGKMDVTLVAYYGDKPPLITKLISGAISELSRRLGHGFAPYSLQQVHGTIIGLEGRRAGKHIINTNYAKIQDDLRSVDLKAVFQILKKKSLLPFEVTMGGFIDGGPYSFTSRDAVPYMRAFSIQGINTVAMGWPFMNGRYVKSLDKLRRAFNSVNILHKYHASPASEDNDFFFVLGNLVNGSVDQIQLLEAQGHLRSHFASQEPVSVSISRDCLRVVAYIDEKLTPETSCSFTLHEAEEKVNLIQSLYREILK